MLLRPFPLLRELNQDQVYIERHTKDLFFACPRHLCAPYFFHAPSAQLNCSAGPDFGFSGAGKADKVGGGKIAFMGYSEEQLHFLPTVMFTLLRPHGPLCAGMERAYGHTSLSAII